MTAANETEGEKESSTDAVERPPSAPVNAALELPEKILDLVKFLSRNEKIVFKSQQIDDPELLPEEKQQIAVDIYMRNRQTFLSRFGSYFEEQHLGSFARFAISRSAPPLKTDEHIDEMHLMLMDLQRKLHSRKTDVRNRRYTIMQQLIQKGEYFSEQEMIRRAPELYQELVGQYLSADEKKLRDSYDVKNTTFSGILMHALEQQQVDTVLTEADKQNQVTELISSDADDESTVSTVSKCIDTDEEQEPEQEEQNTHSTKLSEDFDAEVPVACRQQWGNFDNEQIACSTSRVTKATTRNGSTENALDKIKKVDQRFITASERDLLRQEFVGIMHEQFLEGKDEDFDYTQVDDNSDLDDLKQLNQDMEDEYFGHEDSEDDMGVLEIRAEKNATSDDDESDDELDIFMQHLSKHHSLQKT